MPREPLITIVIDLVHMIEYLWKSAWSFRAEGAPATEQWVLRHARDVLAGK